MSKRKSFLRNVVAAATCLTVLTFAGCERNATEQQISVQNPVALSQTLAANATAGESVTFTAPEAWNVEITGGGNWLTVSPMNGGAGTHTVAIALLPNETAQSRTATVKITCGSAKAVISVTQNGIGDTPATSRLIRRITERAVINSDYYSSDSREYKPQTFEFTYDTSNRLKEIIQSADNQQLEVVTYNYDIAGELRLTSTGDNNAIRGILNTNGTVKTIKFGENYDGQTYTPYTANMTYNTDGYLYEYEDDDYYSPDNCHAFRYAWNNGNLTAVTHKNCTTQVYENYSTLAYSEQLNNKTNLDLNVLCFDILSNMTGVDKSNIYQYPSMFFALNGYAGKRSKNYMLKAEDRDWGTESPESMDIYTSATLPANGTVMGTWYNREFDGNATWQFDAQDFPNKFSRNVKVTKYQSIYEGDKRAAEPQDEWERQYWTERYGAGPWYYIRTTTRETVKNDVYTWTVEYSN